MLLSTDFFMQTLKNPNNTQSGPHWRCQIQRPEGVFEQQTGLSRYRAVCQQTTSIDKEIAEPQQSNDKAQNPKEFLGSLRQKAYDGCHIDVGAIPKAVADGKPDEPNEEIEH